MTLFTGTRTCSNEGEMHEPQDLPGCCAMGRIGRRARSADLAGTGRRGRRLDCHLDREPPAGVGGRLLRPVGVPRNLWAQTVRQIASVSIGGHRVRVVLSNEYGKRPLKIAAAQVALREKGSAIVAGSGKTLTFGGRTSVVIPPGAPAISDPVDLSVAPLGNVVVSFFLPDVTPVTTFHWTRRWRSRSTCDC